MILPFFQKLEFLGSYNISQKRVQKFRGFQTHNVTKQNFGELKVLVCDDASLDAASCVVHRNLWLMGSYRSNA